MVPQHYKDGMQISTLIRLYHQSSYIDILMEAFWENWIEMKYLGYDFNIMEKALRHLARKHVKWKIIGKSFLTYITYNHNNNDIYTNSKQNKFWKTRHGNDQLMN